MARFNKSHSADHLSGETNELARGAAHQIASRGGAGLSSVIAAVVSALALIFSGISLYQTVVKQAQLHMFLPDTISYTREPNGNFEVFALPITITNSGARDGIVSSLKLQVRNMETGVTKVFNASYVTKDGYFSTKEDSTKNLRRPKAPFAPLSVPSRGAYTGVILFYPKQFIKERLVAKAGSFKLRLSAAADTTEHFSLLDRFWSTELAPQNFIFNLPKVSRYFAGSMLSGNTVRLFRSEPR